MKLLLAAHRMLIFLFSHFVCFLSGSARQIRHSKCCQYATTRIVACSCMLPVTNDVVSSGALYLKHLYLFQSLRTNFQKYTSNWFENERVMIYVCLI